MKPHLLPAMFLLLLAGGCRRGNSDANKAAPMPESSGSPVDIKAVTDGSRKAVLKCFGAELAKDPNAGGAMTLRVALDNAGKATKVEIVSSTSSKSMGDCVLVAVGQQTYPEVAKATSLLVPLVFRD